MHIRAGTLADDAELSADVCVVGAGPAGMVLTKRLARNGRSVVLLEAGGQKGPGKSLALYRGQTVDPSFHLPPDQDRTRGLGGTSALWGGRCMPFDPIDFEPRAHVPNSGWPVTYDELRPWYEQAQTYVDCGPYSYDSDASGLTGALVDGLQSDVLQTRSLERWSPPTHFGKSLGPDLFSDTNVSVVTEAVVTGFARGSDNAVDAVQCQTVNARRRFRVKAQEFVLACGGLETTRLLLASRSDDRPALGDHSGWLGRGYMCHLRGVIARIVLEPGRKLLFGYETDPDGIYVRRRFTISPEAQREEELMNLYALLDRPLMGDASHGSASLSLIYLLKRILGGASDEAEIATGRFALYRQHLRNLVFGAPEVLSVLPKFGRDRFLSGRRMPSLLLSSDDTRFYLQFHAEQSPIRESAVTLSDERDATGMPMLRIDPQVADADVSAIRRAHNVIDRELRASGAGRLEFLEEDVEASIRACKCTLGHHIGTTRMAADPSEGVVDADAKIHGVKNLYVASASIFPTSSQAHPTLTVLAFALRLAEHLKDRR